MRLSILDRGHNLRTKVLLRVIGLMSRHPVVDAAKLALYRPDFYRAGPLVQEAMRGPSDWSVGDRELMAAFVSKVNGTEFCVLAHSATSALAYGGEAMVTAVLANLESAPISEPLRSTLQMLGKLTRDNSVTPNDVRAALRAGASRQQVRDALAVAFAFNMTDRLADTFGFSVDDRAAIQAGAKYLLARGYG